MSKIYFGDSNDVAQRPAKIYVGDSNDVARLVSKVYVGGSDGKAHQCWPWKLLPRAYQQVEYIYNTNQTEFINAGFKVDSNTRTEMTFYVDSSVGYQNSYRELYGVENTYSFDFYRYQTNQRTRAYFNSMAIGITTTAMDTQHTVVFNKNSKFYLDGTETGSTTSTFSQTATNLILFGYSNSSNQNGKACNVPFRLYSFKAWQGSTIIRDMYPCYRISDTEVGLFDTVNGVFYGNDGTGIFYKGPDVN